MSLDVDMITDTFAIAYDPQKLTEAKLLDTIRQQGFEGLILANRKDEG